MAKPRPAFIHVNSTGKKKYKLQELMHSQKGYVFIPIDGNKKTDLFNKGYLDGRKQPIPLEPTYESCSRAAVGVIAFSSTEFADKINFTQLTGVIPLDRTFLITIREADHFLSSVCEDCEYFGMPDCFRKDFPCAEEDREKYRDTTWFELKRESQKERKRLAFPMKG